MKRFFKKIIAFAICATLLLGALPVNSARASVTAGAIDTPELLKARGQSLLVEGSVSEGKIYLKANTDNLKSFHAYFKDSLTYRWYVGTTEDNMKEVKDSQSDTYELTSGEDIYLQVRGVYQGMGSLLSEVSSRIIQVKGAAAQVDLLTGVSATDVSQSGKKDGKITGTTYDMLFYNGPDTVSGAVGGGNDITGLSEGQYRVGYSEGILSNTVLKNGFYAIYTIGTGSAPTPSPEKTPGANTTPTKKPDSSVDTEKNPGEISRADMGKTGTKVTVGNVVYQSTGAGSVAYKGTTKSTGKSVTVPDTVKINKKTYPVTELSAGAFQGSDIQKITLGKHVKKIGKAAFKNCKKLKKVTFPSKVQTLGKEAFSGCTKLGSVSLPSSVKTVGTKAFKNCKSMKKITLGKKTAKTKRGKIMYGAVGSKKVTIGAKALENCINLRSVIINSQVTKIGNSTFKNCKKLASILVKSLKLKKVENKALKGVNHCRISVPTVRLKKYRTLFKNKGQGKKVVIAKS